MDFEIEGDQDDYDFEWSDPAPKSSGGGKRNSYFGGGGGDEAEEEDVYDFVYEHKSNAKNHKSKPDPISPFSPPGKNQPAPRSEKDGGKAPPSNLSALEKAQSMLNKYSDKKYVQPVTNFKTARVKTFNEDDISLSSEDDDDDGDKAGYKGASGGRGKDKTGAADDSADFDISGSVDDDNYNKTGKSNKATTGAKRPSIPDINELGSKTVVTVSMSLHEGEGEDEVEYGAPVTADTEEDDDDDDDFRVKLPNDSPEPAKKLYTAAGGGRGNSGVGNGSAAMAAESTKVTAIGNEDDQSDNSAYSDEEFDEIGEEDDDGANYVSKYAAAASTLIEDSAEDVEESVGMLSHTVGTIQTDDGKVDKKGKQAQPTAEDAVQGMALERENTSFSRYEYGDEDDEDQDENVNADENGNSNTQRAEEEEEAEDAYESEPEKPKIFSLEGFDLPTWGDDDDAAGDANGDAAAAPTTEQVEGMVTVDEDYHSGSSDDDIENADPPSATVEAAADAALNRFDSFNIYDSAEDAPYFKSQSKGKAMSKAKTEQLAHNSSSKSAPAPTSSSSGAAKMSKSPPPPPPPIPSPEVLHAVKAAANYPASTRAVSANAQQQQQQPQQQQPSASIPQTQAPPTSNTGPAAAAGSAPYPPYPAAYPPYMQTPYGYPPVPGAQPNNAPNTSATDGTNVQPPAPPMPYYAGWGGFPPAGYHGLPPAPYGWPPQHPTGYPYPPGPLPPYMSQQQQFDAQLQQQQLQQHQQQLGSSMQAPFGAFLAQQQRSYNNYSEVLENRASLARSRLFESGAQALYSTAGSKTNSAMEVHQPLVLDLLQELRKSKEEAQWAKQKLAETIMRVSMQEKQSFQQSSPARANSTSNNSSPRMMRRAGAGVNSMGDMGSPVSAASRSPRKNKSRSPGSPRAAQDAGSKKLAAGKSKRAPVITVAASAADSRSTSMDEYADDDYEEYDDDDYEEYDAIEEDDDDDDYTEYSNDFEDSRIAPAPPLNSTTADRQATLIQKRNARAASTATTTSAAAAGASAKGDDSSKVFSAESKASNNNKKSSSQQQQQRQSSSLATTTSDDYDCADNTSSDRYSQRTGGGAAAAKIAQKGRAVRINEQFAGKQPKLQATDISRDGEGTTVKTAAQRLEDRARVMDPLRQSLAQSLLSSQELFRSQIESLRMRLSMTNALSASGGAGLWDDYVGGVASLAGPNTGVLDSTPAGPLGSTNVASSSSSGVGGSGSLSSAGGIALGAPPRPAPISTASSTSSQQQQQQDQQVPLNVASSADLSFARGGRGGYPGYKSAPSLTDIKRDFSQQRAHNAEKLFDVLTQVYPDMNLLEARQLVMKF